MRTWRVALAGVVVIGLLVGSSPAMLAQPDSDVTQPFTEFSGRLTCPSDEEQGEMDAIFLGRFAEGSFIRRETRGAVFRPTVDEVSDPRLDGTWSNHMSVDEYFYPHSANEPHLVFLRFMLRIENDEGAWQGSGDQWHMPGVSPLGSGAIGLTGEGAYEGLIAVMTSEYVEEPCGWEVGGLVLAGEMPPFPEPPAE